MPQPMLGPSTLWHLEQQNKASIMHQFSGGDAEAQFSRQPDFESNQTPVSNSANGASDRSGQTRYDSSNTRAVAQTGNNYRRVDSQATSNNEENNSEPLVPPDQWQNIIDWVNSFGDPSCLLVSNWTDFGDGIALCHLVGQVACNAEDQGQMIQLVRFEHDFEATKMLQNVELALNVLKASTVSLPDAIQQMEGLDIQTNEVSCFMFLETLRQAKHLGIIKLLDDGSPIKTANTTQLHETFEQQANELRVDGFEGDKSSSALQQSPMELVDSSSNRLTQSNNKNIDNMVGEDKEPIRVNLNQNLQQRVHQVNADRSLAEVVQIDTMEQSILENPLKLETAVNLSPTFKPGQLSFKGADMPLQMDSASSAKKSSKKKSSPLESNQRSAKPHTQKQLRQNQQSKNSISSTPVTGQQSRQHTSNSVQISNDKESSQNRPKSRTVHQQDSNYKPLFTEGVSQKKKFQELQMQVANYDNVIRNSYDRLSANKQMLDLQQQQHGKQEIVSSTRTPSGQRTSSSNMADMVRDDLQKLDRQIQFEQEMAGLVPFQQDHSGNKINAREESSSPRMLSPPRQHPMAMIQQRQVQIAEKQDKHADNEVPLDEIDAIMQQMQTLDIQKKDFEIHPVDEKTKLKVVRWLVNDVKLISSQLNFTKLLQDFPKYCRNGVLFGDLVNRLRGREEVIKGLHRTPKNMTAITANFEKVLGYLKEFPRFSSRYLWAKEKAIEGNPDVIWGLVDDIWHWHFNKISVTDPAQKQSIELRQSSSQPNMMLGTKTTLRTSSSSKLGPRVGSGPPKMQDYLRNGESTGLRTKSPQKLQLKQSTQQPQRPNSTQNHYQQRQQSSSAMKNYQHNFKPSQPHVVAGQAGKQTNDIQYQNVTASNCTNKLSTYPIEDNYHSFGQPPMPNQKQPSHHPDSRRLHPQQQQQQQQSKQQAPMTPSQSVPKLSRPPKAPPQLTSLSSLSSALKQNPLKQPQKFEQVPHLNSQMHSARSFTSNRYSVIENNNNNSASRRAANNKRQQSSRSRSRQHSQFASPRSYSGVMAQHQRSQRSSDQMPQPPMSARNNSSMGISSRQEPQRQDSSRGNDISSSRRNVNSASRSKQKRVHMRTSHDFQEMQSTPFTSHQMMSQDDGAGFSQFKSIDTTSTQQAAQTTRFVPKSTDSESVVDEWLTHLKFHPFMSAEFDYVSLSEDPKRNGIFIAELVAYLQPQCALARSLTEGSTIIQQPGSVVECRKNWTAIFNVLAQRFAQSTVQQGVRLLTKQSVEALMQGDRDILYRILNLIYLAFFKHPADGFFEVNTHGTSTQQHSSLGGVSLSNGTSTYRHQQTVVPPLAAPVEISRKRASLGTLPAHSRSTNHNNSSIMQAIPGANAASGTELELPYTPDELTLLDLSIVQWLKEIGQLKALSIDFENVDSVLDLQGVIKNGVLLCALVSRVFQTRITGVFKDPKTETTCISNIRKALKVLQTSRKMSQKFTWTEKQIYECQRNIIMGILEDIHRAFDGFPPRKRGQTYFDDGPYLGTRFQVQTADLLDGHHQESISSQQYHHH